MKKREIGGQIAEHGKLDFKFACASMQSGPVPANIYTTITEAMIMKQKGWSVTRIFFILGNTRGGRAGRV